MIATNARFLEKSVVVDCDRLCTRFAGIQLFALIYLQKLAVGPESFTVSVPTIIMVSGFLFLEIRYPRLLGIANLEWLLLFVAAASATFIVTRNVISLPSFAFLLSIYGCMAFRRPLSEQAYDQVMRLFQRLMIVPALIIIGEFAYQKATGLTNPLSMDELLPGAALLPGYLYDQAYPSWDSPFHRPNGFFFLEPSFASLFCAAAVLIEIEFFKRRILVVLFLSATFMSLGGTGATMLALAAPFILARQSPRVTIAVVLAASVAAVALFAVDSPLPFLDRIHEFDAPKSSGSDRIVLPAVELWTYLSDPSYLFAGEGPGHVSVTGVSTWPATKLVAEYGLVSMLVFEAFIVSSMIGRSNVPLRISLLAIYNFTGAYLLNPIIVQFMIMMCTVFVRGAPFTSCKPQFMRQTPSEATLSGKRLR